LLFARDNQLNEGQYRRLCNACDEILTSERMITNIEAIQWLHVIREHPIFLKNYDGLFRQNSVSQKLLGISKRVIIEIASLMRQLWWLIVHSNNLYIGERYQNQNIDFLFVSHLISKEHFGRENDFYFGNMPTDLASMGYKVAIILINQTSLCKRSVAVLEHQPIVPRILLSKSLKISKEFQIWKKVIKLRTAITHELKSRQRNFNRKVLERAAWESVSRSTRSTFRTSIAISEIVAELRPRVVVTTYEGHSWERMVYASAKQIDNRIQCVGFLHAALFRLQHAAFRNLKKNYNPDRLLVSGKVGLRQLNNKTQLQDIPIENVGSNRFVEIIDKNTVEMCLVLPEGDISECKRLFSYSLICARKNPNIMFVWRVHPNQRKLKLRNFGLGINTLPENVMLSNNTLEEDISNAKWALYRGSTAIIAAAANGVMPVYLGRLGELSINPLYEISHLHQTEFDLKEGSFRVIDKSQVNEIVRYCRDFYTPPNVDVLENILKLQQTPFNK